jgi:hypothetical protein
MATTSVLRFPRVTNNAHSATSPARKDQMATVIVIPKADICPTCKEPMNRADCTLCPDCHAVLCGGMKCGECACTRIAAIALREIRSVLAHPALYDLDLSCVATPTD